MRAKAAALEADYVVVGCGASGMAFADALVANGDASVIMIDRHARPGGHWNHAYPFVRLHLPSHMYGVNSRVLGDQTVYRTGHNRGLLHMASASEILTYYERVMEEVLLASGRVVYLPMSSFEPDGCVTSRLTGVRRTVRVRRKLVDATYGEARVPSTHLRPFSVAPDVTCVPISALASASTPYRRYCVIGGGKTGMDACSWLLENGVAGGRIHWIVPRDAWWMNRAKLQFTRDYFESSMDFASYQMEAVAQAKNADDLFLRFEARQLCFRLDPQIQPTMYHGATATISELNALRQIENVVRMGHVTSIERDRVTLDGGTIQLPEDTLYVDCSAAGIPVNPPVSIFERTKIRLQWVKPTRPVFSAALIGCVEAMFDDDGQKNELCTPMSPPREPADWLKTLAISMKNQRAWALEPRLMDWIKACRLDPATHLAGSVKDGDESARRLLDRLRRATEAGAANLEALMRLGDFDACRPKVKSKAAR